MASYQQFTLWTLPDQPLPRSELKDPVFVTVWLFLCLLFAAILRHLLNKTINPTWQEFRTTMLGTLFLAFWYIITAIDRWLRYDGRAVKYGYIIIAPIWESFRVTSTILLLWGTYTVVWKELEDHFSPRQQGIWWFAAKFALFIVALMSIFYVVLYLALSVVWMEFFSLNVIADIATKRTGFEIAMTAFFMAFGLLTLAEATAALVIGALKVHGHMEATRLFLWLAALLLFARSTAEFAIITNVYSSSATRQSTQLAADIAYGLITVLYLAMMCCMAKVAASTFDRGGRQAKMVASDIRQWVLQRLDEVTNGARKESPAFETIIRQAEENLNNVLANGPLTSGLMELNQAYKEQAARDCIALLRGEFGKLNPKEGAEYTSRPATGFSSLFGRRSKSTQILNASTATLTSGTTHPTASNSSATTGTSQPSASTGATLFEDPRGFGRAPSTVSSVPGPPRPINLNRPAAPGPQNTGHVDPIPIRFGRVSRVLRLQQRHLQDQRRAPHRPAWGKRILSRKRLTASRPKRLNLQPLRALERIIKPRAAPANPAAARPASSHTAAAAAVLPISAIAARTNSLHTARILSLPTIQHVSCPSADPASIQRGILVAMGLKRAVVLITAIKLRVPSLGKPPADRAALLLGSQHVGKELSSAETYPPSHVRLADVHIADSRGAPVHEPDAHGPQAHPTAIGTVQHGYDVIVSSGVWRVVVNAVVDIGAACSEKSSGRGLAA
ncbi:hypothetical protein B0T22DRAFT_479103 [Podospora appendiculata]|uniref:Uncharacterized protein n=1 Tax=Podospora appendiculata TaxID=314037 RepID=A0AAE0X887_9PEZI|nr:hypothetical protein B0T22DRAFT_479103 [Podospora appendiculata]